MKASGTLAFVLMLVILLIYLTKTGRMQAAAEALQGKLVIGK